MQTGHVLTLLQCQSVYLSVGITDQDHLLKQLAIRGCFRNNLPENQQQLLDGVVLEWQHKADYGHQQSWQFLTIQDHDDDLLQGFSLGFDFPFFCKKKWTVVIIFNNTDTISNMNWVLRNYH